MAVGYTHLSFAHYRQPAGLIDRRQKVRSCPLGNS